MNKFNKEILQKKVAKTVANFIWKELANLKGIIDTGDKSAAPYNITTTSIYLTGNQVLLGLTKESLEEMINSDVYSGIYEADLEKDTLEEEKAKIEKLKKELEYQLKNSSVKALKEENKYLQDELDRHRSAIESIGYVIE